MGEEIGSIRVTIETDLQFQKAPLVYVYDAMGRAEHGPRRALVIDLFMHVGVMEKPS